MAALLTVLCLTGCASSGAGRLVDQASTAEARANVVDAAISEARKLPERPADCRRTEQSGTAEGDRLDVAWLKAERALGRANARIARCAAWDDDFRRGLAP
jgi:hypothetical protein